MVFFHAVLLSADYHFRKILLGMPSECQIVWILTVCKSYQQTTLGDKQWCSQNAEKVMHIKGRLLEQAVIFISCVLFHIRGTSLKGKKFLMVWKITFTTLGDLP